MIVGVLAQGSLLCATTYFFWKLFRGYVAKNPLDDVPGPPPTSFWTGSLAQFFNHDSRPFQEKVLDEYGSTMKFRGLLGQRILFLHDPKALYHIFVKDQAHYEASPGFVAANKVIFGDGLMAALGAQHKKQRKMLNPVFSPAHLRDLIPMFYEVAGRMKATIIEQVAAEGGTKNIDMLDWMTRTSLEMIGRSGLGYSFDPLTNEKGASDYTRNLKRLAPLVSTPGGFLIIQYVFPIALKLNFPRIKRWIAKHWPSEFAKGVTEISDTLCKSALEISEKNRKAIQSGDPEATERKDIISILMRANASVSGADKMSDEEVHGQIVTLVFAAMDTTSSMLTRILHCLILNPDVQDKLRKEIIEAINNQGGNELSHDQLVALPYLDAVVHETLRMYPPLPFADRIARKDMVLPLAKPIIDIHGKKRTEIIVPNGTTITLSILGANTNTEMWGEDAREWKPERWISGLPSTVGEAKLPVVYSNIMTFVGGNRACIGFKFSELEMKVVLCLLLSTFKFEDAGEKIVWKTSGVAAPVIDGTDIFDSKLPMIVSLLKK